MLEFEGDVENTFCRNFTVESEWLGETIVNDLKEGEFLVTVYCFIHPLASSLYLALPTLSSTSPPLYLIMMATCYFYLL